MKHLIYHACTRSDARKILKGGFKKPLQEKLLKDQAPSLIFGQGEDDVVSFGADKIEPWLVMKAYQAISASMAAKLLTWPLKIDLVCLEFEVDEDDINAVFPSAAMVWSSTGPCVVGKAVEIIVNRVLVNSLIRTGNVRLVSPEKVKPNRRLVQKAKGFKPNKVVLKMWKRVRKAHQGFKKATGS